MCKARVHLKCLWSKGDELQRLSGETVLPDIRISGTTGSLWLCLDAQSAPGRQAAPAPHATSTG